MKITVLGSGSSGNSILLQNGHFGILVDAGFSLKETEKRLWDAGFNPESLQGIIISHEHMDHIRGAEGFSQKYRLPVFVSEGTYETEAICSSNIPRLETFTVGKGFELAGFHIRPFIIAHDAADPAAFVIETSGIKIGISTDLGYITNLLRSMFADLDLMVIESNYDPHMLMTGPYPWHLKQRISSRNGHLSNPDAAQFLLENIHMKKTRHIFLAHISETNNTPQLAYNTCRQALTGSYNGNIKIYITNQHNSSETLDLEAL